jgi:hypothetical protein
MTDFNACNVQCRSAAEHAQPIVLSLSAMSDTLSQPNRNITDKLLFLIKKPRIAMYFKTTA